MVESVFVLAGELDEATRAATLDAAEQFWATVQGRVWVVDLTDVGFIDSTGLGLLVEMRSRANDRGAAVIIRNPSPRVVTMLRITGMTQLFTFDPPIGTHPPR
jgi:anti-sigma B factor antagonist